MTKAQAKAEAKQQGTALTAAGLGRDWKVKDLGTEIDLIAGEKIRATWHQTVKGDPHSWEIQQQANLTP